MVSWMLADAQCEEADHLIVSRKATCNEVTIILTPRVRAAGQRATTIGNPQKKPGPTIVDISHYPMDDGGDEASNAMY
jgi:hypothetical protein